MNNNNRRDPIQDSKDRAQTIRLPVRDGRMVIPPTLLTPGDSLVVDIYGHVTIQRGDLVFARIEPDDDMGPFQWPNSPTLKTG